jgi:hypothetical protein
VSFLTRFLQATYSVKLVCELHMIHSEKSLHRFISNDGLNFYRKKVDVTFEGNEIKVETEESDSDDKEDNDKKEKKKKKKKTQPKVGASCLTESEFKEAKISEVGEFLENQEDNCCCLKRGCDPCTIETPCFTHFRIRAIKNLRRKYFGRDISKKMRRPILTAELKSMRKV